MKPNTFAAMGMIAAVGLCLTAGAAWAEEPVPQDQTFGALTVIEEGELGTLRAADANIVEGSVVSTTQELDATVIGSTFLANEINTGGVSFGENALDNFSGIGLFNIVTGNNNAVNTAIGITFNLN